MATVLRSKRDADNQVVDAFPFSDVIDNLVVGTTAVSETIPAGATFAVISADANVFCNPNGTAVVPTANVSATGSMVITPNRTAVMSINGRTTLSFIASAAGCHVSIEYYSGGVN